MRIYDNIKALCQVNRKTVLELESELGFARSSISKWNENMPSIVKVKQVADYFGVTIEDLINSKDGDNG